MSKSMINVQNVGMQFNLGIEKNYSFKQAFVESFGAKRKRIKNQNDFWALRDINLSVEAGEVVGIIGSNGAGKSTLLKIVAGVMKPTVGSVNVEGNICPMIELGAGFDGDLSARENVFLNGAVMGYSREFIDSKLNDIVAFAELSDFMEVPVKNFSSGMVARLAFSIATMVEPEVLIVDEILSVGDLAFQKKSEEKMRNMIANGTTVLYVSHSLETVRSICDKVLWIEHGQMMEFGKTDDICDNYLKYVTGRSIEEIRNEQLVKNRVQALAKNGGVEKVTGGFYYDQGNGYNEADKLEYQFSTVETNKLFIKLPKLMTEVRFDPVEYLNVTVSNLNIYSCCKCNYIWDTQTEMISTSSWKLNSQDPICMIRFSEPIDSFFIEFDVSVDK